MSHDSVRWRSPAWLGSELSFRSIWRAAPMGLDQPFQSIITASGAVMMPSASPPQRASGQVSSLLWYATLSWLGETPSLASFPLCYSQTWVSNISQGGLSKLFFTVMFQSTMNFVELLWTLKSHSLGQSEDRVKVISCLHFILLVDILGDPSYYGSFFCNHSWVKQSSQGR
jgi:hypothetical protein